MNNVEFYRVPKENTNDDKATVVGIFIDNGQNIVIGTQLIEFETAKTTFVLDAKHAGYFYTPAKIGDELNIGEVCCCISEKELTPAEQNKIFTPFSLNASAIPEESIKNEAPKKASITRLSEEAKELLQKHNLDPAIFKGRNLLRKQDIQKYLLFKSNAEKSPLPDADQSIQWVNNDPEPECKGFALYSKAFIRRIIGGKYSGGEVSGWKAFISEFVWVFHFIPLAVFWLLSKLFIIGTAIEIVGRIYRRNIFGFFLRGAYYKSKLRKMGQDVIIDQGVEIWGAENVSIGNGCHLDTNARIAAGESRQGQHGCVEIGAHVHIGPYTHLAGRGGIKIGSYTAITAGSKIFSATNVGDNPDDPTDLLPMSHAAPLHRQRIVEGEVVIGNHAFIGLNVCILPGVTIGKGAIINSGAVVTRNVPEFSIVKGSTMEIVGKRLPKFREYHE